MRNIVSLFMLVLLLGGLCSRLGLSEGMSLFLLMGLPSLLAVAVVIWKAWHKEQRGP